MINIKKRLVFFMSLCLHCKSLCYAVKIGDINFNNFINFCPYVASGNQAICVTLEQGQISVIGPDFDVNDFDNVSYFYNQHSYKKSSQ